MEAVGRHGRLRQDDGRVGLRGGSSKDCDDLRDLPQNPPHGEQPAGEKGGRGRLIGRTKGGMNTKLHAICDSQGRPLDLFVTAGPVSDYIGARALLCSLPKVDWLLGDRGYDADWFREALKHKGIRACIPGRKQRKTTVKYDKRRYKRRNRIEIMFGKLKDWRRIATRYDRCPKVFLSAIALAAAFNSLCMCSNSLILIDLSSPCMCIYLWNTDCGATVGLETVSRTEAVLCGRIKSPSD
jgi:transposase